MLENRIDNVFPPEFPSPDPGFPRPSSRVPIPVVYEGTEQRMSLRAYAAIHLRVPDSGIDWLDRMILQARKLDHRE